MTFLILFAGLTLVALCAVAIARPTFRVPAVLFALLAMPGNVDNLLPQMTLDVHQIANNTAPVVSAIDALILLAVAFTVREGGWSRIGRAARLLVFAALSVWLLASATAAWSITTGVEPAAAIRGSVTFLRIPAVLFIAFAMRRERRYSEYLAVAGGLGIVALVGNGIYTSTVAEATRFTASTFGRNGFSVALTVTMLLAGGVAVGGLMRSRWLMAAVALMAASVALFGAIATGTRASLLAVILAALFALVVNRTWLNRRGVASIASAAATVVLVSGAAVLFTPEGGRALSIITDPGETVDVVTNPDDQPWYSPVRTRTHFWRLAADMIVAHPVAGVGPFQWNIQRYALDPEAARIVVDPHNTYLQIAAEFGLPVLIAYVLMLGTTFLLIVVSAFRRRSPPARSWTTTCLVAAALMIPITEATNSHFFNIRLGPAEWLLLGAAFATSFLSWQDGRVVDNSDLGAGVRQLPATPE